VQLILAGQTDVRLAQLASRRLYQGLMRSGIEIYEYQPQILHGKLILVDDVVYAGSANLDARSLNINYELLVRAADAALAADARRLFEADLRHSARINAMAWRKSRGFWTKLMERFAYFVLARMDPYVARRRLRNLYGRRG
jgi:cardiolipin synthase